MMVVQFRKTISNALLFFIFSMLLMECGSRQKPASASEQSPVSRHTEQSRSGNEQNAVQRFLGYCLEGNNARIKELLEGGLEANTSDRQDQTCLMMAAYNGHSDIVKILLEKGAEPGLRNSQGRTALMFAATGPFAETVRMLLEAGARPNAIDSGEKWTPLMFAAAEGQTEVVRVLLEHGADPSLKDADGETAYDFAHKNGHSQTAHLLED